MRRASALTAVFVLLMSFPCVARQSAVAQMDFIGDLVNSVVMFAPKGELRGEFSASPVRIFPEEFAEMAQVFIEAVQVLQRSGERRRAHLLRLRAQGIEEEPMSMAGAAFEFNLFGCRFAFDRYGYMHFDDRFVRPAERKTIERAEAIYRRMHKRWMAAQAAKSRESNKKSKSAAIADRAAEWRVRRVPVFKGFEDDRYQEKSEKIIN